MKEWLQGRMILAAPELAADENSFRYIIRLQKRKKRHLFQKILLNRVLFTGVALIIQMIWLGMFLGRFATLSQEISFALTVISLLITIYILAKNENSAYKLSWLVIILSFPIFGGVLYLFFGIRIFQLNLSNSFFFRSFGFFENSKFFEEVFNEV